MKCACMDRVGGPGSALTAAHPGHASARTCGPAENAPSCGGPPWSVLGAGNAPLPQARRTRERTSSLKAPRQRPARPRRPRASPSPRSNSSATPPSGRDQRERRRRSPSGRGPRRRTRRESRSRRRAGRSTPSRSAGSRGRAGTGIPAAAATPGAAPGHGGSRATTNAWRSEPVSVQAATRVPVGPSSPVASHTPSAGRWITAASGPAAAVRGDGDGVVGAAGHEVAGAVDRIDDPLDAAGARMLAGLLGQDRVAGAMPADLGDGRGLGRAVGGRHQVVHAELGVDRRAPPATVSRTRAPPHGRADGDRGQRRVAAAVLAQVRRAEQAGDVAAAANGAPSARGRRSSTARLAGALAATARRCVVAASGWFRRRTT